MHKRSIKIVVGVVAAIVLILILIPLFVNGEAFRPAVESQLSGALGRKVNLGHLSFSLFSGSLVAKDISIADDPAFSSSPFLHAKELGVGVEIAPLLFHHQAHITRLELDSPAIQLIQNQAGKWNFSSIGRGSGTQPKSQGSSSVSDLTVGELRIKDGSAAVSSIPATARPFEYSGVDVTVKNFSFRNNFPFELSANLPANGSVKVSGTAGPISAKDASDTPFKGTIHIAHLDPVAAGAIEAGKGISMIADADAQLSSDGRALAATGKIQASKLQVSRTGSPAPQPVNVDFNIANDLEARTGRVNDIAVHAGSAAAHVNGTYRLMPQAIQLNLHLAAPNLPIDQLQQLLPAFGVQVPSGSQLKGGTLTANLNVSGPATATSIAGPVEIDNTQLAGFDLGSKIQGLNAAGKTGGGTQIQVLKADVNSTPQATQFSNIYGNLPQLGSASGSGTVSPSGALNFRMVATLSSSNMAGNLANQAMNQASSYIGGFLHPGAKPKASAGNKGIPLIITGTASSPSIRADVGGLIKSEAGGLLK